MINRVFLIVLDSFGIGEAPDAALYGDTGSDTLGSVYKSPYFSMPNTRALGLFNIEGVTPRAAVPRPLGSFARMREASRGKDTTTGHWEMAGLTTETPFPTYPGGFPDDVLRRFEEAAGRKTICNRPYSGTQVINDFGGEHLRTGALIVYTSADSVFQIAAHEDVVPPDELYRFCKTARALLTGPNAVGRVIARPFTGTEGSFARTARRHDFSLTPPGATMLDLISGAGLDVIGVGKIGDIFAMKGLTETHPTVSNRDGMDRTLSMQARDFHGLCFVNLVDFDMLFGHRNDISGYAKALGEFDCKLGAFLSAMRPGDALFITADHGCDPAAPGADHSREYVPMIACGRAVRAGADLRTLPTFADLGATVTDLLCAGRIKDEAKTAGTSFARRILN